MRRFSAYFVVTMLCLLVAAGASAAKQPGASSGYTLVASAPGTAALVSPGFSSNTGVLLASSGASGWGAIGFASNGLKLRDVTYLSTEYEFTLGSCWEGSPRFTVGLSSRGTTKEIYFYMGPPPSWRGCPDDTWMNTGNLASLNSPVDISSLGGSPDAPYSQVLAKYGNDNVAYIAIDFDGGFYGAQTAEFDNTQVNQTLYTYEP